MRPVNSRQHARPGDKIIDTKLKRTGILFKPGLFESLHVRWHNCDIQRLKDVSRHKMDIFRHE